MVTGAYGKPVPKQMGAPLRLRLPWKYGFKSIKSIVRISFIDQRPMSFWEELQSSEYGFWANVNPEVSHPRWSQATERVLGTDERVRRCSSTAMANSSPTSTRGSRRSASGRDRAASSAHARASGHPALASRHATTKFWVPAFAGTSGEIQPLQSERDYRFAPRTIIGLVQ